MTTAIELATYLLASDKPEIRELGRQVKKERKLRERDFLRDIEASKFFSVTIWVQTDRDFYIEGENDLWKTFHGETKEAAINDARRFIFETAQYQPALGSDRINSFFESWAKPVFEDIDSGKEVSCRGGNWDFEVSVDEPEELTEDDLSKSLNLMGVKFK